MAELISPEDFHAAAGLDEWRAGPGSASVRYRTPDFSAGARFVGEIAQAADELDHHPDVDLRYGSVRIRTATHSEGGLTSKDVELAQRITGLARSLGFTSEAEA